MIWLHIMEIVKRMFMQYGNDMVMYNGNCCDDMVM